jgi:hypothetical protein
MKSKFDDLESMSMYYRIFAALSLAALLLGVGVPAHASPVGVDLDFVGPGPNSLTLNASADGVITTGIIGKLIVKFTGSPNPQTDPISLSPDTITVLATPDREPTNQTGGLETANLVFDVSNLSNPWTPMSITDVNLDLLNGTTPSFALDTVVLETTAPIISGVIDDNTIKIDVGGTFTSVKFYQNDGAASFTGNTYAIPGTLVGIVDLSVGLDAFGGSLALSTGFGTQEFETPFTLEGTLGFANTSSVTFPGGADADLTFDGVVSGSFLLTGISTTITFDSFGATASISLDVSGGINLDMEYHLEDTAHVPEPGTIILFGLGAIGLVPVIRRRFRKS